MGDMYGHSEASQIANQLGRQSLDMNERNTINFENKRILFDNLNKTQEASENTDVKDDAERDITSVPLVYKTTAAIGGAAFKVPQTLYRGGTLSESLGAGRQVLRDAGQGSKIFGEGAVGIEDITGVEGIVAKTLFKSGGGELFSKVAAKGVGEIGAAEAGLSDVENFVATGNIFNSKNPDGSIKKQSLGEDVGNISTIVSGGLDVLAAFTGGALAPIAAAANIFAATESTYANIKEDEKEKGTDERNPPGANPPPVAAQPAFAQLGLLSNVSHNPIDHIG